MSKQIDALKPALEALLWANEEINGWRDDAQGLDPIDHPAIMSAISAIKEALAQPEQDPVRREQKMFMEEQEFYATPPQRTWVGLTKQEAEQLVDDCDWYNDPVSFCFDVEAKLKEKNGL